MSRALLSRWSLCWVLAACSFALGQEPNREQEQVIGLIQRLWPFKKLRTLRLDGTQISEAGLKDLKPLSEKRIISGPTGRDWYTTQDFWNKFDAGEFRKH
jgi:hypothetical protein